MNRLFAMLPAMVLLLAGPVAAQSVEGVRASVESESGIKASALVETRVEPMLETEWGQTTHNNRTEDVLGGDGLPCYNSCTLEWPEDASSAAIPDAAGSVDDFNRFTTHYPAGCVATAGAQLMKKWGEPQQSFDFGSMPCKSEDFKSKEARMAVGGLMAEIGDKCNAVYGPQTSMTTEDMVAALRRDFGYDGAFWRQTSDADFVPDADGLSPFARQVIPNLIAGCPVSIKLEGHSAVIDGLQFVGSSPKFHVNFGWAGESGVQNNAWYVPPVFATSKKTYEKVLGIGVNIHPREKKSIVAGRVVYEDDKGGIKGAKVVLKLEKNDSKIKIGECTTDAHGQFYFFVDGGRYSLEASMEGEGFAPASETGIETVCSDNVVSNDYREISLSAAGSARVETPAVETSLDGARAVYVISMSCATEGATVRYTLDGSLPTEDDPEWSAPFSRTAMGPAAFAVTARAFKPEMPPSDACRVICPPAAPEASGEASSPIPLSDAEGSVVFDNASVNGESGESCHSAMGKPGGAPVWFVFTAPEDGDYVFSASGTSSGNENAALDTQLAVYSGDAAGEEPPIVANDDVDAAAYDMSSRAAFAAVRGARYRIVVDTFCGERGSLRLSWKRGREDVASPEECSVYCPATKCTRRIRIRSTAPWRVCDGSDWISATVSSGEDGDWLVLELPKMPGTGVRKGIVRVCAGERGPASTIMVAQGSTVWATSRAEAVSEAKAKGKRILMVGGSDTDPYTRAMRFTVCEDASVKSVLESGYVLWYCNCDKQRDEYDDYASGLGEYFLPVVCIIDPVKPKSFQGRLTGPVATEDLERLLGENDEGSLPSRTTGLAADGSCIAGAVKIDWTPARRAATYEIWRGVKWDPRTAVMIASDVHGEEYVDLEAEESVLYYYRVRALNGSGAGEFSEPAVGCWRNSSSPDGAAAGIALGAPHLEWTTGGDYPWVVRTDDSHSGGSSMQSADFDPDDPANKDVKSVLETSVSGPVKMSFRYKTRMYRSRFAVYVDGKEAFLSSEDVPEWTVAFVDIPEGEHRISFSYEKWGWYQGFNGAWLDTVQFDVLSVSPTLSPETTDDEFGDLAPFEFTGSMTVSILEPEGSVTYYTLDGSEPTRDSPVYGGPFEISKSTRVRAVSVQEGFDCSAPVSGLYLERHDITPGEWTTDVDGAIDAASKDPGGSIVATLLADYRGNSYCRQFAEVAESKGFLCWAKANGVYLVTADASRFPESLKPADFFWYLFDQYFPGEGAYVPSLVFSQASSPDNAIGCALAGNAGLTGSMFGKVKYTGTAESLVRCFANFVPGALKEITVSFDANGGTVKQKTKSVIRNFVYGELPTPSRPATSFVYAFDGWFTDPEGGEKIDAESEVLAAEAHTLYAHWTPTPVVIEMEDEYKTAPGGMFHLDLSGALPTSVQYALKFEGLPSGLAFDQNKKTISGTASKPGSYTVRMTVRNPAASADDVLVKDFTVVVAFPALKLGKAAFDDASATGTVSGEGVYPAGKKVSIKATPAKNCIFIGWYEGDELRHAAASANFEMPGEDLELVARFATAAEDAASLKVTVSDATTEPDGTCELDLGACVESLSIPRLAVKGLPAGLKFDAKTLRIAGKATKPGVYVVKVEATNASVKKATDASTEELKITVPNFTTEMFNAAGLDTKGKYVLAAGVLPEALADAVSAVVAGGWKLAVSGLPPGVKYDAKKNVFSGVATKEGFYTATFTATRGSGKTAEKQVATATLEVTFPTLSLGMAAWDDTSATNKCKVAGGGKYPAGAKVTLKTTPDKGKVFAGWFDAEGKPLAGAADYRTASFPYIATDADATLTAKFATEAEDAASLKVTVSDATTATDGTYEIDLGACVESASLPKLSVKGLPTGIKYDAKTLKIAGKATKPGVYVVKVEATNASVKKATPNSTGEFKLAVPNFTCGALPNLKPETDAYGTTFAGVALDPELVDCTPAEGWTVKVAGLPAGLKYDTKTGKIAGVSTAKAGSYTVTFTATKGKEKEVATITLNVEALPAWAVGTFAGCGHAGRVTLPGQVSLAIDAKGKISGKVFEDGATLSFSAASFDSYDADSGAYLATVVAKVGKELVTNEVAVAAVTRDACPCQCGVVSGWTVSEPSDKPAWTAWQDLWKRADTKAGMPVVKKDIKVDIELGEAGDANNMLTLTFKKDGAVAFAGKIGGAKVSGSSQLVWDPARPESAPYQVTLYAPPKGTFDGYCETFGIMLTIDENNVVTDVTVQF